MLNLPSALWMSLYSLIHANAYIVAGLLSEKASSTDDIICVCKSFEFPGDQLLVNIYGVLRPGGTILVYLASEPPKGQTVS